MIVVGTWVLMRTRQGNWIFAVGGDANAARAVGVRSRPPRSACSWPCRCRGLVGMINAFDTVQSGEGAGNEFLYIIAAVIGGRS